MSETRETRVWCEMPDGTLFERGQSGHKEPGHIHMIRSEGLPNCDGALDADYDAAGRKRDEKVGRFWGHEHDAGNSTAREDGYRCNLTLEYPHRGKRGPES